MISHYPLSFLVRVSYCIFPFILNLCFYIFIGLSITTTLHPLEVRNAIAITDCFFIYIIDIIILFVYGKCMGSWSELLYGIEDNLCIVTWVILTYPVFFIFFLPYLMYSLLRRYNAHPSGLWERAFGGSGASLELLNCDGSNGGFAFGRYIYIGIPFFIFAVIYLVLFIAFVPLWYFIFSPFGMTMYSVCLAVCFTPPDAVMTTINDRVDQTYNWGLFLNVFGIDLLAFLSSACYVGLVGSHAHAVILLVVSVIYFAIFSIYSIYRLVCGNSNPFEFP